MKETMNYLTLGDVIVANNADLGAVVDRALSDLDAAKLSYPDVIMGVAKFDLAWQIDLAQNEAFGNPRINPYANLSSSAGAYFYNEEVLAGSRKLDAISTVNKYAEAYCPDWPQYDGKVNLGGGIGFIETSPVYQRLIDIGLNDVNQTVNYTSPLGSSQAREGMKLLMNSKIDPEVDNFTTDNVFLTQGGTEGIDLYMDSLSTLYPCCQVQMLGLSYYTGPFSAQLKGLSVSRIMSANKLSQGDVSTFPNPQEIRSQLSEDTKGLVLTMPNNPTGETYNTKSLRDILELIKEKDILLLYDCVFDGLSFDQEDRYKSRLLQEAVALGCLDNIVTVDSLSKTRNFPGERIGILATTNSSVLESITNTVLARRCNPRLPLGPLLQFEGIARAVTRLNPKNPRNIATKLLGDQDAAFSVDSFVEMYDQWGDWNEQALKYYSDNLKVVEDLLEKTNITTSANKAAFNTLLRLGCIKLGTSNLDFMAKLMFTTGTYTQFGPCFGLSQPKWDKLTGVCPRVTYSCSRRDLVEGLKRLLVFSNLYTDKDLGNGLIFPQLEINYDNQV